LTVSPISLREDRGWLVVSPDGLFDGTANALVEIGWQDGSSDVVSLDAFYNDFFNPGLLPEIFGCADPKPQYDLATRLRFPALRTMAQQGLASIQKGDGKILARTLLGWEQRSRGLRQPVHEVAILSALVF
jgi:hypothetical protein